MHCLVKLNNRDALSSVKGKQLTQHLSPTRSHAINLRTTPVECSHHENINTSSTWKRIKIKRRYIAKCW